MMNTIDKNTRLDKFSIVILILSGVIILFSFFAPIIFVQESHCGINFSDKGQIGDTIGGIMNPFIAIAGVFLTFLAFYIQYKANKLQRDLFRQELDSSKFENQFYEMLRLHKDNVNELEINTVKFFRNSKNLDKSDRVIKGRNVFNLILKEFELCYYMAKRSFPESDVKTCINEAYGVFFHGLNSEIKKKHEYFNNLYDIKNIHEVQNYSNLGDFVKDWFQIDWQYELNYSILDGYSSQLGHYYRHLFQTVKFVVNGKELTYEEKRNYLRILRAQLSNQEQAMLFYNWISNFGKQWENKSNHFFTDYRMVHNIYPELLIPDIDIKEFFNLEGDYLKEKNRDFDPLFEFQDW